MTEYVAGNSGTTFVPTNRDKYTNWRVHSPKVYHEDEFWKILLTCSMDAFNLSKWDIIRRENPHNKHVTALEDRDGLLVRQPIWKLGH